MKKILIAGAFLLSLSAYAQHQKLKPFDLQGKVVQSIDYSPDGLLLAGAYEQHIQVWNLGKDSSSFQLTAEAKPVTDVAFSNDSRYLLAAHGNNANIWDVASRKVLRTFGQKGTLLAVAYTPDNKLVALGGKDKTVQVWQVDSGELLHTFEGHQKEVTDVTFSLDGSLLISASADKTIKVWDLQEKKLFKTLEGHKDWVKALALSRDSTYLVSAGYDGRILLWNLPFKEATTYVAKLKNPHTNWISSLDVNSGNTLVSIGHDNKIALYSLHTKPDKKGAHFYQETMFHLVEQQPNAVRFNPYNFQVAVATLGNGIYYDNYFQLQLKTPHDFKINSINGEKVTDVFKATSNTITLTATVSRPEEVKTITVTNIKTKEAQVYTGLATADFTFAVTLPEKSNTFKVVIEDKDSIIKPVNYEFKVEKTAL
ncbi:WD40 repeat domain-containing protein [Pontibacter sp. H259]|uniref:WD40 repeat domain-containing protein n=1 Tax=Pontibacter sp. H259 TaxID=3133421 RepID=UPI0030BF3F30